MIFSELYSAYYNAVAGILRAAVEKPLKKNELRTIIEKFAFGESVLNVEPAIAEKRWPLLREEGRTPICYPPTMPMTTLEKRWLKAICDDPRIKLFTDMLPEWREVEPLFRKEDITVFDRYSDGDPYEEEAYIRNFRLILHAVKNRIPLSIDIRNRSNGITHMVLMPICLEYSEKDDKFRLIGLGSRYGGMVNLARIVKCEPYNKPFEVRPEKEGEMQTRTVEFELVDRRNALERVLMHFAHFEKQAEKIKEDRYRVKVTYDKDDETEMVIRILAFGPMVKVTSPQSFVELIKERLVKQRGCEEKPFLSAMKAVQ